jgi:type II secretory pathway pseudopilin PulG
MMRRLRETFAELRSEERGITLVELIVAMTMGIVILSIAGSFFVSAQKTATQASNISTNTRLASNAMNESTRMLQSATQNPVPTGTDPQNAFQYTSAASVRFFTFVNTASTDSKTQQVQLTVDPTAKTLTETTWSGSGWTTKNPYSTFTTSAAATLSATPTTTRVLATSIVPGGTSFSYAAADGTPAKTADAIASVTVTVMVGANATDKNAVVLTNTVSLVNVALGGS